MTFTIDSVLNSLAGVLKSQYQYPVYLGTNQQGTETPCFFIVLMPSTVTSEVDERFFRDLGIDIVFLQQRNSLNGNAEIQAIQEYLDYSLELFEYSDGVNPPVLLRTYDREASTEDQELHYKLHIKQRVSIPRDSILMQEMEEANVRVKEKSD